MGVALDEPAAVETFHTRRLHRLKSCSDGFVLRLLWLNFHRSCFVREGPDEAVSVAKLGDGDRDFCFYDGVDAANLVGDFPCTLEEDGLLDVAFNVRHEAVGYGVGRL